MYAEVGRDWCLPGQCRVVLTLGNNQKRYLAGALHSRTGQLTWVEGRSKASALFIQLLWRLAGEYRDARRLHLILDNAAIHRSKKVMRALAQLGGRVVLHFLPPYCPQANRIERVWLDLHAPEGCQTIRRRRGVGTSPLTPSPGSSGRGVRRNLNPCPPRCGVGLWGRCANRTAPRLSGGAHSSGSRSSGR